MLHLMGRSLERSPYVFADPTGTLQNRLGEHTFKANAGAFVLVPRGTVHAFPKIGTSAKMLIIISPAGFEKFFEKIAGPPDLEKVKALAPK
jgi:quercetin dioxygenase-like cupin family protein